MRFVKFLLSLAVLLGLIYLLDNPLSVGETKLPALGRLLNPFTGFWQNAEPLSLVENEQTLSMPGLQEEVRIIYDGRMVPHIFAQNTHDAILAQGYVTARHRLWQLDISIRDIGGRLSEVLGPRLLERDKSRRRQGMLVAARREVEAWEKSEEISGYMQAYTDGINAYINQLEPKDYPLEYKLLGYAPEQWTPLKSALFHKNMANTLCRKEKDVAYTNALLQFGRDTFDLLYPEINPQQSPIIPEFTPLAKDTVTSPDPLPPGIGFLPPLPFEQQPEGIGSNNWAVAGSKTRSGYPILCNDPHLNLTLPAIWYEIQLHTPKINAYGASLPGIPGIIIGFNEQVAWGVTNVGHDVTDFYTIKWLDEEKTQYEVDGEPMRAEVVEEKIFVKGQEDPVILPVRYTAWGPVVSEEAGDPYRGLAMRWIAHDPPPEDELHTFLKLNAARGYADYLDALSHYTVPPQNFVFASQQGDIALRVNGKFPIRGPKQARFVQPGNTRDNAWKGYIPYEDMPMMHNPERGFVGSANQRSTGPDYPYYYFGFFDDYRGRYLNRRLEEMNNITVDDMMDLQQDNYTILAEDALPALLTALDSSRLQPEHFIFLDTLSDWDYRFDAQKQAPILFYEWYNTFKRLTWDEYYNQQEDRPIPLPQDWVTIALLKEQPQVRFFDRGDTPERESARDIVTNAFLEIADSLSNKLESAVDWGHYLQRQIPHLARIPAFSYRGLITGGFDDALNSIKPSNGPSWRMVVELGPEVSAFGVYPGGQSGNPGSPYYQNMVESWAKGEYYELKLMKDEKDLPGRVLLKLKVKSEGVRTSGPKSKE